MARRRYQRGSLSKEGNRWIARWREDVALPSGEVKRVHRKEMLGTIEELATKKLAQRELDKRLEPINRVDYRPTPKATFKEFAEKWQKDVMVHHKPSTQRSEKSVIKVHLVPAFGALALRDIQPEMVQRWVTGHPASPKTVRNIVVTMQTMWTTAKAWGYASHDPFAGLKMPTVTKGNTYHFTVEETLKIIEKAQGRWKVFFRVLAETGMRPGELAGLRICDVGPRSLQIKQSAWQGSIQTPKTQNAVRSFAISASLGQAIQEMIDDKRRARGVPDGVNDGVNDGLSMGLLFTTEAGGPIGMDNFRHRVLGPILEELKIQPEKRCGLYAFRHMNLTTLSRNGVPLKTIQKRAGHAIGSDVTMTHYIHAVDSDDIAAADMMGALLSPREMEVVQ